MKGETRRSRFSNPLLTDPAIHPDLKPLFDAVVMVSVWSRAIASCYPDLLALKELHGLPKPSEWPDSPVLECSRAQHVEWVKAEQENDARRGESVTTVDFLEPEWAEKMREWSGYYRKWCEAIAKAKALAEAPDVAAIMDAGESRPAHRWTIQTILDLDSLASTMHPIGTGGVDGLGFIRCGLPPLPKRFHTHAEAVGKRIGEMRSIPVSVVTPVPTGSASSKRETGSQADIDGADSTERRGAKWFREATKEGLYADLLRVAVSEGRLEGSIKTNGRWIHSIDAVSNLYPAYRQAIDRHKAKETEASVRERKQT